MSQKKRKLIISDKIKFQAFELAQNLEKEFSKITADAFSENFERILDLVEENPEMFPAFSKDGKVRKGYAHKHVSFLYRINKKSIRVFALLFNRSGKT